MDLLSCFGGAWCSKVVLDGGAELGIGTRALWEGKRDVRCLALEEEATVLCTRDREDGFCTGAERRGTGGSGISELEASSP